MVAPAAIETDMFEAVTGGQDEAKAYLAGFLPIGRIGTPLEVANAVLFLGDFLKIRPQLFGSNEDIPFG